MKTLQVLAGGIVIAWVAVFMLGGIGLVVAALVIASTVIVLAAKS